MIDAYQQKRFKSDYLLIGLCVFQIIWVNVHIFFMMGPLLTAIFWLQARINREKQQADVFQKLFFLLLGMCFINPFGVSIFGVLFDTWDKASSFPIIESLSVLHVLKEKIMPFRNVLVYFLVTWVMLGSALIFLVRREGFKKYILMVSLTLITGFAAMKANRMIGLYGYLWMPLAAFVYSRLMRVQTAGFSPKNEVIVIQTANKTSSTVTGVNGYLRCSLVNSTASSVTPPTTAANGKL